jgi:ABC-type Fe3+/spermidine/putrescine transport system ATPase subunit
MEVALAGLRFDRDRRTILDIPSLRIRNGVTTAILGPNGSGKTTILRLIAGLEMPAAGHVHLAGRPARRGQHLAYVFQEHVFLRRSVRSNLEFGLQLRGVPSGERRARVDAALALLGIEHLGERRADRLSGGEGRRVSLARALCLRAPLVLLDEPLQGLDERTYSRLLDELPHLLAAFDATTILVTHSRDEALRLAEDLVIVVAGKVCAAGEKRVLIEDPRTVPVAEVLGYVVLNVDGRATAVSPRALKLGAGVQSFAMEVVGVVDLVESQEVLGRIAGTHVRIALRPGEQPPAAGTRACVHAERTYQLEGPAR